MNPEHMDLNTTQLKKQVMRRIYAIWFFRRVMPVAVIFPFFILIAAREVSHEFFVARIFDNFTQAVTGAPSAPLALLGFAEEGLRSAGMIALLVIGVSLALCVFACFNIVRNMREAFGADRRGRNFLDDKALQ